MSWLGRRRREAAPPEDDRVDDAMPVEEYVQGQAEAFLALPEATRVRAALDFSVASLTDLDGFLGDLHDRGGQASEAVLAGAACYLMAVVRGEHGGIYQSSGPEDPLVLVVQHEGGRVAMLAFSKVRGRVVNGPEDDLVFFYGGVARSIAARESALIF